MCCASLPDYSFPFWPWWLISSFPPDIWQSTVQAIKDASQSNEVVVDTVADSPPVVPETPASVAQVESVMPEPPVVVPEPASVPEPVIQRTEGLAAGSDSGYERPEVRFYAAILGGGA